MLAGEAVKDLVDELDVTMETLYRWRRQALIDTGQRPGAKSSRPTRWPRTSADQRARSGARDGQGGQHNLEEGEVDPKGSSRLSGD